MPTDRDLRNGFDRAASHLEPDVQRHLHQTLRHGRRRSWSVEQSRSPPSSR